MDTWYRERTMSIDELKKKLAAETRLHEIAIRIRALMDEAEQIELPDDRNAAEEAIALASDE